MLVVGLQELAGLDLLDPVLADLETAADGVLAQRDVVRLRAGQVLQQVPERARRDHPQLDPRPVVGDAGDLGLASLLDRGHPVVGDEGVHHLGRRGGRGDQVDVLGGLGVPAEAARDLAAVDGRHLEQRVANVLRERSQPGDRDASPPRHGGLGARQDRLLRLLAHSGEVADPALARRLHGVLQRDQTEVGEDPSRRLGADAGDVHDRHHAGRRHRLELLQRRDVARVEQLGDLVGDGRSHARQLAQPALLGQPRHRLRRLAQRLRSLAVGEVAVGDGTVQLEQVGEQLESSCNLRVVGRRGRHRGNDRLGNPWTRNAS